MLTDLLRRLRVPKIPKPTTSVPYSVISLNVQPEGGVMVRVRRTKDKAEADFMVSDTDFGGPAF